MHLARRANCVALAGIHLIRLEKAAVCNAAGPSRTLTHSPGLPVPGKGSLRVVPLPRTPTGGWEAIVPFLLRAVHRLGRGRAEIAVAGQVHQLSGLFCLCDL